MLIALLLAAAAPQPAPGPAQAAPVPREAHLFHDWVVACDNGRRCQAVALHPESQDFTANGIMVIERGPEAEAPITFRLAQVEGTPARLTRYDQPLAIRLEPVDGDIRIEPANLRSFLDETGYADLIALQDAAGTVIGQVSLKGMRSAMLYMDEVQGRLHTPTALIRTGRSPAGDVPPPPLVPVVRLAPSASEPPLAIPAARIARLRRDHGCAIDDVGGPDEVETAALGGGRTLVLIACGTGAYNVTNVPFVATRQGREIRIDPAPFDIALDDIEVEEGRRMLVNAEWDGDSMILSDFSKGRGLGDCGSRSRYGWDGSSFRLIAREEMPECRGSIVYVTTWRAQVVR
jgi:Protein of unknown function (DUF1176)